MTTYDDDTMAQPPAIMETDSESNQFEGEIEKEAINIPQLLLRHMNKTEEIQIYIFISGLICMVLLSLCICIAWIRYQPMIQALAQYQPPPHTTTTTTTSAHSTTGTSSSHSDATKKKAE